MKKIGITGGIGSGKSTLSNYFKRKGYMVHDSDSVVAELYEKPNRFFLDLLKSFRTINIVKKNKIDKAVIAKNLFVNKALQNKIEKYIHKQVMVKRNDFIKKQKKLRKKLVFLDIPLLLENGLEKEFDLVLCIISTKEKRTKRVMQNKKFSKEFLSKVLKNQTSDKERRLRSDIVIINNKTKKNFFTKAEKFLDNILK